MAQKVPVFIEVAEKNAKPETQVCHLTMNALNGLGYSEIPLATSIEELTAQLAVLKELSFEPAVFILNTYNARDLIKQLDPLVGETPIIFLRRNMYAGKSGLSEHFDIGTDKNSTMAVMKNMRPRLVAKWNYGSLNAPDVARTVARAVDAFLKTGDFKLVERQSALEAR